MGRRRWIQLALALAASLAGATACGPKHKNQCAGTVAHGCVNGEVCSFDRQRGCQVCECRPFDQTPTGNDPDDPNPPIPVH
jgi:hypothetical protein